MGHNQTGDTFDEKVYSLFSLNPLKEAEAGTYNECSHPSVMICFRNNISPDVMKFIGVLQMVKGLGLNRKKSMIFPLVSCSSCVNNPSSS